MITTLARSSGVWCRRLAGWIGRHRRPLMAAAGVCMALAILGPSCVIVDETEFAWIADRRSDGRALLMTGIHAKWPWEGVRYFSRRAKLHQIELDDRPTSDGLPIQGEASVAWRLPAAGVPIRADWPDDEEALGRHLAAWIGAEVECELMRWSTGQVLGLSTKDDQAGGIEHLARSVRARVGPAVLERFGVQLIDLSIVSVQPTPPEAGRMHRRAAAVFHDQAVRYGRTAEVEAARVVEEATLLAAEIRLLAGRRVSQIRLEMRTQAARLIEAAESIDPELAALMRTLDEYRSGSDEHTTLVLEGGREFFRLLEQETAPLRPIAGIPSTQPSTRPSTRSGP